jgi:hypothetical protein
MMPTLLGLRAALDRAIEAAQPLEGVLAAWQASSQGAQESTPASSRPLRCRRRSQRRLTGLPGRPWGCLTRCPSRPSAGR